MFSWMTSDWFERNKESWGGFIVPSHSNITWKCLGGGDIRTMDRLEMVQNIGWSHERRAVSHLSAWLSVVIYRRAHSVRWSGTADVTASPLSTACSQTYRTQHLCISTPPTSQPLIWELRWKRCGQAYGMKRYPLGGRLEPCNDSALWRATKTKVIDSFVKHCYCNGISSLRCKKPVPVHQSANFVASSLLRYLCFPSEASSVTSGYTACLYDYFQSRCWAKLTDAILSQCLMAVIHLWDRDQNQPVHLSVITLRMRMWIQCNSLCF